MRAARILALLTAVSAFYLLVAGAQVNANQAALSVPDWPLSYGKILAPTWPGNVFYEQHHRAVAGSTLVLFLGLSVALARVRGHEAAKRMARYAGGALAIQIVLGGLIVLRLNPPWLGALHAAIAVATVVLIADTALLLWERTTPPTTSSPLERIRGRARIGLGLVGLQIALGAVTRHPLLGELTFITTLMAHLLNGVITFMFLVLLALSMVRRPKIDRLGLWGWSLLTTVLLQLLIGAWLFVVAPEPFDQPVPPPAGFPTAHAAHLVVAAAIATCLTAPLLRDSSTRRRRAPSPTRSP